MFPDAVGTAPEADPFAMPASEVDTRFPRLQPDRIYRMCIVSAEKTQAKETGNDMIVLKMSTTKEELDTDGKTVHPGFPIFHRIGVVVTKDRDANAIKRDVALVLKAVGKGSLTVRDAIDKTEEVFKDQIVDVKVGLQKAKDGYPESNKISSFVIPGY